MGLSEMGCDEIPRARRVCLLILSLKVTERNSHYLIRYPRPARYLFIKLTGAL